ncbi:hypothetical protein MesoLj113c_63940 [Mesorhizobium sp. 113-3-9]|nr:hypothetical protein MesoLj113c_63940 [Mesorhizobium sp. 113-3-9]
MGKLGRRGKPTGVKLVEGAELLRSEKLILRAEVGQHRLQPLGQASRAIVVAHSIKFIGHGKMLLSRASYLNLLPSFDYPL